MKIPNISNSIYFKSNDRHLHRNSKGELLVRTSGSYCPPDYDQLVYSNYTNFFRPDLNSGHISKYNTDGTWSGFCQTINDHFKNAAKVNVYDFACSDGSEAYSLILSLIDKLGEKEAQKYFPIHAYDIDEEIIKIANSGKIPLDYDDIRRFHENIKNLSSQDYYDITFRSDSPNPDKFVATKNLKDKVQFKQADIMKMLDSIEPTNSLVLCRNFFPYLDRKDIWEIIGKLRYVLDDTSLVIIGRFDKFKTYKPFMCCGFEEVCMFIYKKMPNNSF